MSVKLFFGYVLQAVKDIAEVIHAVRSCAANRFMLRQPHFLNDIQIILFLQHFTIDFTVLFILKSIDIEINIIFNIK